MNKRIGNDLTFTWKISRKNESSVVPENFNGKDVEVILLTPSKKQAKLDDITISTGVISFVFKGKNQIELGQYIAILSENKGDDDMVTIDTINAVTLVPHSYMEQPGEESTIEVQSVDLESLIIVTTQGGGGIDQQQADWAQTDNTAVDYIKNKPTLASVATSGSYNDLTNKPTIPAALVQSDWNETDTTSRAYIRNKPEIGGGTAASVSYDNTRTGLSATNVQDAIDEMADTNLYETVVLTVGSADSSFSPVGQTITVTLEDGSATQYTVPMSRQITFIVQRGMRYTISGTSTDDYRVLPISVKAAIPTRYLTMRYIPIATGVFILQKDGNYYLREEYDAETMAEDAVGVLVLTSALINAGYGIVIAKDIRSYTSISWPTTGQPTGTNISETSLDGYAVTTRVHGNSPSTDCAINKAFAEVIQMDDKTLQGYLGSKGEWTIIVNNRDEINQTLLRLSTNTIDTTNKLTSTPNGAYGASYRWKSSTGVIDYNTNGSTYPFFYYEL